DECVARVRRGERPTVSEYALRYPQWADAVREVFPAALLLEELKGPQPSARGSAIPPVLGDYRLVREVGRGGMGIVYEAEQLSLGRRVALKILPFAGMLDERTLTRFRNEARAAATLNHPNIVPIIGSGEERGIYYYAMQL